MDNKMKPGDMIEWVYTSNQKLVVNDENMYSSAMDAYVPIGTPALLISIADNTYMWLSDKGLFHASVDDECGWSSTRIERGVVPRVRQLQQEGI